MQRCDALGARGSGAQIAPPRPNLVFSVCSSHSNDPISANMHMFQVQWTAPIGIDNEGLASIENHLAD